MSGGASQTTGYTSTVLPDMTILALSAAVWAISGSEAAAFAFFVPAFLLVSIVVILKVRAKQRKLASSISTVGLVGGAEARDGE